MSHRTSGRPFLQHAFMSWTSIAALVASSGCDDVATTGPGGAGGAPSTSSTTNGSTTKSSTVATTSSKASSSSGMPFVCDPPAEPGSLYEQGALLQFEVEPTSMCQYRGQVLLIVDTAAQ